MRFAALFIALTPVVALAQDVAPAPMGGSPIASLLPLVLIFVVFYFLLIRPQQKRMKEHQSMLGGLKKGDEVVTGGGIIGKVTKVNDDSLTIEIASGVEVKALKSTVTGLLSTVKAAPVASKKNDNKVPNRDSVANDN